MSGVRYRVPSEHIRSRKACRKDTERTLDEIGLPQRSREPIADQNEITRLWLAKRCFECLRCQPMVDRMARWHAGIGED